MKYLRWEEGGGLVVVQGEDGGGSVVVRGRMEASQWLSATAIKAWAVAEGS